MFQCLKHGWSSKEKSCPECVTRVYPDGTVKDPSAEGLKSGMAIIEEMFHRGEITEEQRKAMVRDHLLSVYGRAS